jgi:hypothetical protein
MLVKVFRPALKAADSGLNGAKPAAIKSALMNLSVWASEGKKSRASLLSEHKTKSPTL